jgi:superfamily II DNA or RNA helicase
MCKGHSIAPQIIDKRRVLPEVDFNFNGALRPYQIEAVAFVIARDFGTLPAPTGSGKTVVALWLIKKRSQPALIVVHTKELLNQWIDRIETFLGIPADEIGIIGDGQQTVGDKITIALVQSLYKCADEVAPRIGHLVVDECHRTPSRTFTEAVTEFDCKYMLGLSATPWRRDKLSRLIFWHLGDVVHEIKKDDLIKTGDVLRAEVIIRETDFEPFHNPKEEYAEMLSELVGDPKRNRLIAQDVANEANHGNGVCLVLTDRKAHCDILRKLLSDSGVESELLTGDLSSGARQCVVDNLKAGQVKVLVATGQLIGEGFDCEGLSTLFLTTPIRFSGRVLQYVGRILRPASGKKQATVYDYVDVKVGILRTAAVARQKVYNG